MPKSNKKVSPLIKIVHNPKELQLIPESSLQIPTLLHIDRGDERIQETKTESFDVKNKSINCYGVLGLLRLYGRLFLFYVEEADQVAVIHGNNVYKARAVGFIKVQSDQIEAMEVENLKFICKYLRHSLFYSYGYDLTLDLATKLKDEKTKIAKSHRYWWNFNMLKPFFKANVQQGWCVRAIQGYTGISSVPLLNGRMLDNILISRREWLRGGTRYNHRGIDMNGNTANFVETEQIFQIDTIICSHIQIRGSVPIFWNQVGIRATSQLTKDFLESKNGFNLHFTQLNQQYKSMLCVNLMSKDKGNESIITKNYEDHLQSLPQPLNSQIKYQAIDFHSICKNFHFSSLNSLIIENKPTISEFSFNHIDLQKQLLIKEQKGVVRTNCLDCLDRTNVFMTKIALMMAQDILTFMGVNVIKEFGCPSLLMAADVPNDSRQSKFLLGFKQIWADNGDAISKVYVGTNATTTKASKQGGGGWTGMFEQSLKGIERFYRQNFEDKQKQDIYELIVGLKNGSEDQNLIDQIQSKLALDRETKDYTPIMVINWNLNNVNPFLTKLQPNRLNQYEKDKSPEYIIVLITNIPHEESGRLTSNMLKELFQDVLPDYESCANAQMFQQLIFVFVKKGHTQNIDKVEYTQINLHEGQGAIVCKLVQKTPTIGIINMTLKDQQEVAINKVLSETMKNFLEPCDFIVLGGDLNLCIRLHPKIAQDKHDEIAKAQSLNLSASVNQLITDLYQKDDIHQLKIPVFVESQPQDCPLIYDGILKWYELIVDLIGEIVFSLDPLNVLYIMIINTLRDPYLNPQVLFTYVKEDLTIKEEEYEEMVYSQRYYDTPPQQLKLQQQDSEAPE